MVMPAIVEIIEVIAEAIMQVTIAVWCTKDFTMSMTKYELTAKVIHIKGRLHH